MNQEQIEKIIKWLEEKKENQTAEFMLDFLKQDRPIGEKSAFIKKNINPTVLRKIIY